jgi:Tol biopolymer transport system component
MRAAAVLALGAILTLGAACGGGAKQRTPMPTGSPAFVPDIAYIGPDQLFTRDIWLAATDGSGKRNVTQGRCPNPQRPEWSPAGDRIACIGRGSAALPETRVLVFDLEGHLLLQIQHAASYGGSGSWTEISAGTNPLWSADGRFLAYVVEENVPPAPEEGPRPRGTSVLIIADAARGILTSIPGAREPRWSTDGSRLAYNRPPGDTLAVYDPATTEEKVLGDGLRPLAWALGGEALVVAADYHADGIGAEYAASLLDPATGQMTPLPELNNGTQFWLSPDGTTVAFLTDQSLHEKYDAEIALLDLASGEVTPIIGSVTAYPGEMIPRGNLAFSADGSHLCWAEVVTGPSGETYQGQPVYQTIARVYRATAGGGGLTKVGELPSGGVVPSANLERILYTTTSPPSNDRPLRVANMDGSSARLLAENGWYAAWRPLAPLEDSGRQ